MNTYEKRTRKDLRTHPLAVQFQDCDSPAAILAVLQPQVLALDQSRNTDERWTKWLDPTINVLYTFSNIIGASGLVCFRHTPFRVLPSHIYVAGILTCERHFCRSRRLPFSVYIVIKFTWALQHVFPQTAKDIRASQDALVDILERIEMFFRRLEVYTEVQPTTEMMDIVIQIIVEVLSILGIVTKEIKQGRLSKFSLYKYFAVD